MKALLKQSNAIARAILVGFYFTHKAQTQAANGSITRAAKNLRKQRIPVEIAVMMLAHR